MTPEQEIKLLKNALAASYKMVLQYRTGSNQRPPQWVFDNLQKAKTVYGEDLTNLKSK